MVGAAIWFLPFWLSLIDKFINKEAFAQNKAAS